MGLFSTADTFYAFRFLRLLTTAWADTGAFKAGLIDKDGKQIRKAENSDERSVYNIFHRLVFNVKRLLNKVPFGKTTIASYITALYLIKEHTGMTDDEIKSVLTEAYPAIQFPSLTEDTSTELQEGVYVLARDLVHPMTGAPIINAGSTVTCECFSASVGNIFGVPMFKVMHEPTKTFILINKSDIVL